MCVSDIKQQQKFNELCLKRFSSNSVFYKFAMMVQVLNLPETHYELKLKRSTYSIALTKTESCCQSKQNENDNTSVGVVCTTD
jgi:hypothetical protein